MKMILVILLVLIFDFADAQYFVGKKMSAYPALTRTPLDDSYSLWMDSGAVYRVNLQQVSDAAGTLILDSILIFPSDSIYVIGTDRQRRALRIDTTFTLCELPCLWQTNGNTPSASTTWLGTTNSKDLIFKTNNTEVMRIDATGNVGIGATSPAPKLYVVADFGSISVGSFLVNDGSCALSNSVSSTGKTATFGTQNDGSTSLAKMEYNNTVSFNGFMVFYDSTSVLERTVDSLYADEIVFVSKGVEAMRIDTNANAGIGTSEPAAKLHVNGDGISPTAKFDVNGVEAMRIDTNGNVGIGTATPAYKLDVEYSTYPLIGRYSSVPLVGEISMGDDNLGFSTYVEDTSNDDVVQIYNNLTDGFKFLARSQNNPTAFTITSYFDGVTYGFSNPILRIDTFERVGIGTASASAKLHVKGDVRIEGTPNNTTSDSLLTIDNAGNVSWRTPYYYGTDTLTNGVDTVWTSDVTANSNIQLTSNGLNGSTQSGHLDVTAISAGNYFVVNSLKVNTTVETGDQRKYYWFLIRKP